jgi:hypothetical protein
MADRILLSVTALCRIANGVCCWPPFQKFEAILIKIRNSNFFRIYGAYFMTAPQGKYRRQLRNTFVACKMQRSVEILSA